MLDTHTSSHRFPGGLTRQPARRASHARRGPSEPLRIAVLGPSRHPVAEPYAGGLESFVGTLVDGLRARGHQVLLFAGAGSPGVQPEVLGGGSWAADDLARTDSSMPAAEFMSEHHDHLRVMTALRTTYAGHVDVVHNNSLHYLPLALADTLPVPVVTSLHTPPTPWLTSALAAGGGSAAFTCVSGFTAAQWSPHVSSVQVVPNGVVPRRWRLGPGRGGLLWFGRIVPEKAPHLALRAAALAGRHLDLVGPVADRAYFAAEVEPLLGANATYRGHLGGHDLSGAVGNASAVLVTPVWDEPFGLVCAEAAMSGTPVVAFDRGGIREVLSPGGTTAMGRVVPPDDVAALAAAVDDVLGLDRREVRRHALEHLSFDGVVDAYERLYARVLGRWSDTSEGGVEDQVEVAAS